MYKAESGRPAFYPSRAILVRYRDICKLYLVQHRYHTRRSDVKVDVGNKEKKKK